MGLTLLFILKHQSICIQQHQLRKLIKILLPPRQKVGQRYHTQQIRNYGLLTRKTKQQNLKLINFDNFIQKQRNSMKNKFPNNGFQIDSIYCDLQKVESSLNGSRDNLKKHKNDKSFHRNSSNPHFKEVINYGNILQKYKKNYQKSQLEIKSHTRSSYQYTGQRNNQNILKQDLKIVKNFQAQRQRSQNSSINPSSEGTTNFNQQLSLQSKNQTSNELSCEKNPINQLIKQLKLRNQVYKTIEKRLGQKPVSPNSFTMKNIPLSNNIPTNSFLESKVLQKRIKQVFDEQHVLEKIIEQFKKVSNLQISSLEELLKFLKSQEYSQSALSTKERFNQ